MVTEQLNGFQQDRWTEPSRRHVETDELFFHSAQALEAMQPVDLMRF